MAGMTVHVADATQIARIAAKIFTADKLSRTLTEPLPAAANEAIALVQEAAADIEALGVVPEETRVNVHVTVNGGSAPEMAREIHEQVRRQPPRDLT